MNNKAEELTSRLQVHLACNDDGGNFSGELDKVELMDDGEEPLLTLEFFSLDGGLPFSWAEKDLLCFKSENQVRAFQVEGRGHWVGSMAWEATTMDREGAEDFARYLIARGFSPTEWVEDEPWASIAEEPVAECG